MRDTWVPDQHTSHQLETFTSGHGKVTAEPSSQPRETIVHRGNPRIPIGVPKEYLLGIDYLEPNKITVREISKLRVEYRIPDSVRMRIPSPTKSLSNPEDDEVIFFTDILQQGYAPGQYNSNFLVALMGVIVAFGLVEEGEPTYEQFYYLYSVTKSKYAGHRGWV